MKLKTKNISFLIATTLLALVAVLTFMQFTHASAANVREMYTIDHKFVERATDADQPGEGNWIITVNVSDANLNVVNTVTDMVYGPFLEGQLGPQSGALLDVVLLPDRPIALVSNFGESAVHFVDFSNPISPSWILSVTTDMFAEDIDLTADGRFAVVTDGGFNPIIAVVDTVNMTLAYTVSLTTLMSPTTGYANAIEIAPDGTAIVMDYFPGMIHTLLINETGYITYSQSYTNYIRSSGEPWTHTLMRPVNLGIAPDGETILICNAATDTIPIYRIIAPGVLTFTGVVTGVAGEVYSGTSASVQSVAFNAAGDRAYANVNGAQNPLIGIPDPDRLSVLNIDGPGMVSLNTAWAASLTRYTGSQYFGVDTIAVAGNKAYVGHPTGSWYTGTNDLAVVDLTNYSTYSLTVGDTLWEVPTGIGVLPIRLGISKQASVSTILPGQTFTYTIVLDNLGPQITGLAVNDLLPTGLNFVGPITLDPPTAGVIIGPPTLVQSMTIAALSQVTITFPVSVSMNAPDGVYLNAVSATSPEMTTPATAEAAVTVYHYYIYMPTTLRH